MNPVAATDGGSADVMHEALADLLPDGVFVAAADGRYVDVNAVGCAMFGLSRDQVLSATLTDLLAPAEHHRLPAAVASFADGRVHRSEWTFRRADGSHFPGELHGRQLPDGRLVGVVRDMSDQTRTNEALVATEDKYRVLFDSIDQGFCIIEMLYDGERPVDYRFLQVNAAFVKHTGLVNAAGRRMRDMAPGHEQHWFDIYGRVARTGTSARFENTAEALGREYDVYAFPIAASGKNHVGILFSDITDRKRAEKVLYESEERQAFLLKLADATRASSDPVATQLNAAATLGRQLRVARAHYAEMGPDGDRMHIADDYRIDGITSVVGDLNLRDFGVEVATRLRSGVTLVVDDIETYAGLSDDERAAYRAVTVGAYIAVPLVKDGRFAAILAVHGVGARHWSAAEVALVEETAERTWAAVERARAEAALRDSAERLRVALAGARMGTWRWDIAADRQELDPQLRAMIGAKAEAMSLDAFIALVHPDDRTATRAAFDASVATGAPLHVEFRVTPGGVVRWLRDQGELVGGTDGRPRVLTGACVDITDTKEAAESLRIADRRKNEFLAVLAHELRNPLAPIATGVQVLKLAPRDSSHAQRQLRTMEAQLAHIVRLIDDLLDVSRISRGVIGLQKEDVALPALVTDVVDALRAEAERLDHRLTLEVDAGPLVVHGDAARLSQVVSNLVANAIKYTDRGGVVDVSVARENGDAVIRVRDNGRGIPTGDHAGIFEMFAQLPGADGRREGLGIGLWLVRELVQLHDGRVEVHSEGSGKGSEFVVRLPLAGAAHVAARGNDTARARNGAQALRVLVVDDNRDAAQSLATMLDLLGHRTRTAFAGADALAIAADETPDVVLMDIGMPGMDGYEVAKTMRRGAADGPLLVAVTGWGQDEDRRRAMDAGFDFHLVKPIDFAKLEAILADAGTRRR